LASGPNSGTMFGKRFAYCLTLFSTRLPMRAATQMLFLALAGLILAAPAPAQKTDAGDKGKFTVKVIADNAYCSKDQEKDAERQKVDLYLPEGKKEFPVLVYVHGGGWTK